MQAGEAELSGSISGRQVHVVRQFFPPRMDVVPQASSAPHRLSRQQQSNQL